MQNMDRRLFLGAVTAAFPLALMGQSSKTSAPTPPVMAARVPGGEEPIWRTPHARRQFNRFQSVNAGQQRLSLHHGAHESQEGRHDNAYSNSGNANDKELFHAYGMELLGPPLSVE
jgi:hypothetical protein